MRVIKFRGKNAKSGEWLYGSLILYKSGETAIAKFSRYGYECSEMKRTLVDPETVGQFTGLHDKHGHEIYKGDILLYNGNRRIVEWKYGTFGLSMHENGFPFQAFYELPVPIVDSTVIGNIHDNPQLLKGGEQ